MDHPRWGVEAGAANEVEKSNSGSVSAQGVGNSAEVSHEDPVPASRCIHHVSASRSEPRPVGLGDATVCQHHGALLAALQAAVVLDDPAHPLGGLPA